MFIQIKCSYRESEDGGSANCGQKTAVERQTAATGKRTKRSKRSHKYEMKTDLSVMGVRVDLSNFFFYQSIGIDETNICQLTFFSSMKIVGATGLFPRSQRSYGRSDKRTWLDRLG